MVAPHKPTALKVLHGTQKASRVNHREPLPTPGAVVRPENMSPAAAALWDRIQEGYGHTGILTPIDSEILRAYCDACARYEVAAEGLDRSSTVLKTNRGDLVKNPLHQIARDNAMLMLRLGRELGFTPSARAALQTPDEGDELDAWLRSG